MKNFYVFAFSAAVLFSLASASAGAKKAEEFADMQTVKKKAFTVIGREGSGPSVESKKWTDQLWKEFRTGYAGIKRLVKKDKSGAGFWGIKSDIDGKSEMWGGEGIYLAGAEVEDNAEAPAGWTKRKVPERKYLVVKCSADDYDAVYERVVYEYIPNHSYELTAEALEFYPADSMTDDVYLYFPVKKK